VKIDAFAVTDHSVVHSANVYYTRCLKNVFLFMCSKFTIVARFPDLQCSKYFPLSLHKYLKTVSMSAKLLYFSVMSVCFRIIKCFATLSCEMSMS